MRLLDLRIDLDRCSIHPWRRSDRDSLVRHADNRKIWRYLADILPHPDAEREATKAFVTWVLEKVGCAREGVLRRSVFEDGQMIDRVMDSITRDRP